jgi:hypothetical protein
MRLSVPRGAKWQGPAWGDDYGNSDKKDRSLERSAFIGVWAFCEATSIYGELIEDADRKKWNYHYLR